jgi:spermidine synthase
MLSNQALKLTLFVIFSISGFSGLIYESIWTHYLKLVLGHAAHSQTLVLILFMGGMAIGAWLVSRKSETVKNPVIAYAIIELIIGVLGLLFHQVFITSQSLLFEHILPMAPDSEIAGIIRWTWGAILILPQSILLGATFPLMSAGIVRLFPANTGSVVSTLYFSNSIGAAVGVLVSGFVLIDLVGLPGTILTAGLLNILLALFVWAAAKHKTFIPLPPTVTTKLSSPPVVPEQAKLLLLASAITGLASFFYEIGWIRMLNQVLGTTNQSFELMISAFITGLALGGLWVRQIIDKVSNVVRFAGHVQIIMAFFAVSTLLLYDSTFDFMAMMMQALQRNEAGYRIFITSSHMIAFVIMTPAAFMAGMTLPLFTYAYMNSGRGEKGIGRIYAANTLGSIAGIILAVHLVMPLWGVKNLIAIGAFFDLALGMVLLIIAHKNVSPSRLNPIFAILAGLTLLISVMAEFDRGKMASGVFRKGTLDVSTQEIVFNKDGKTASVSIRETVDKSNGNKWLSILTNGKPDAAVVLSDSEYAVDEPTMVLLAAYPLSVHPDATTAAVIGMGSGITSHTLLQTDRLKSVDTIEIESAMVEGARFFGDFSRNVFNDPRSHIHIDDAKSFISANNRSYDLIISEPSNPWVSGVSSLFTQEFYRHAKRHLNEDGVFAQWLQIYEIDVNMVASVLKAMDNQFKYYAIYQTVNLDTVILASDHPRVLEFDPWIFDQYSLKSSLERLDIRDLSDLYARRIGTKATLQHLFNLAFEGTPPNSDYFPLLGRQAPKTRFLTQNAQDFVQLPYSTIPLLDFIDPLPIGATRYGLTPTKHLDASLKELMASMLYSKIVLQEKEPSSQAYWGLVNPEVLDNTYRLVERTTGYLERCSQPPGFENSLLDIALLANIHLPATKASKIWQRLIESPCFENSSEAIKTWILFFESVAQRSSKEILIIINRLLSTISISERLSPAQASYLYVAGLAAHLSLGQIQKAQEFVASAPPIFAPEKTLPLNIKLLQSLTAAGIQSQP